MAGRHALFVNTGSYASLHEEPWSLHVNNYMEVGEAWLPELIARTQAQGGFGTSPSQL